MLFLYLSYRLSSCIILATTTLRIVTLLLYQSFLNSVRNLHDKVKAAFCLCQNKKPAKACETNLFFFKILNLFAM